MSCIVITERPPVEWFCRTAVESSHREDREVLTLRPDELPALHGRFFTVTFVCVDIGHDLERSLSLVAQMQRALPDAPVVAVTCCDPYPGGAMLAAVGVDRIVSLSNGVEALQLHLDEDQTTEWEPRPRGMGASVSRRRTYKSTTDDEILRLLVEGCTDREIANGCHLSPHTVHHRIERLCSTLRVRNRVSLAAWAGRHGY